jgi:4-hydroxy 2-oxovalerate aldolase
MVDAGAQCVYCVDSAGALVLGDAQERVQAMYAEIGREAEIGFHGHQNLSLGVANSVLAYQHGARQIDGALCALGAGAGNSPTEVLAATFDHLGVQTGVDVGAVLAAAEEVVRPFLPRWPKMDRSAIVQGWAGVYSSFLLHAERAAERYGVPAHEILQRAGELGYVGGQEDMIIDIALSLAQERDVATTGARGTQPRGTSSRTSSTARRPSRSPAPGSPRSTRGLANPTPRSRWAGSRTRTVPSRPRGAPSTRARGRGLATPNAALCCTGSPT